MCKKQTSEKHSSTESEVKFLYAGLRMDGIPALDLWDLVVKVLHSSFHVPARGNPSRDDIQSKDTNTIDYVVTSAKPSHFEAMLYIFEDKRKR